MPKTTHYYTHSGKAPIISVFFMIICGLSAAFVLSAIYGYAIAFIPFIYLNFFITLGFGVLTGVAIGAGGKLGKARNPGIYAWVGLVIGLFAEYAGWVAWVYASFDQTSLIIHPGELLVGLQEIAETGAWSIFGWTPTGFAIYCIWTIEGLMIVCASALIAFVYVESTPFCEHCSLWVENVRTRSNLQTIENEDEFKTKLEEGQYESLLGLKKADDSSKISTEIELNGCKTCENSNYLSLSTITVSVDDKGKESKDSSKFVCNFRLTNEQHKKVSEFVENQSQ